MIRLLNEYYHAQCDSCSIAYESKEGFNAFADHGDVEERIQDDGWMIHKDEQTVCPYCQEFPHFIN